MRRTKIVCTLGPATTSAEAIAALIEAGMDVARLNFSHGDHDSHRRTIRTLRRVAADLGREVAVLQDLCGPKIRLGVLPEDERVLTAGEEVVLVPADGTDASGRLPVGYDALVEDVAVGDQILLADGLVELEVREVRAADVVCEVITGGPVSSHKGVNLPETRLRVPSVTDKDRRDLALGLEEGVDLVALSFVRHEDDVAPVAAMLDRATSRPLVVAKIEKPQAVERLEPILARVDAVMVARGDLGVEMPVEEVPLIQKRVIRQARQAGRPVITATQMLRSMVSSPRPLRAEASDVANAILDGTDAVMLSEETAIGRYPVEAVAMLDRLARAVEPALDTRALLEEEASSALPATAAAISRAACWLALDVGAAAIVACTASGSTARLVARLRPGAPIIGLTASAEVARQLALSWGVRPARVEILPDTDAMLEQAVTWAREHGFAAAGDRIIVTAGLPINQPGTTNLLRVMDLE
jgi:pyruvate kinase